MYHGMYRVNFIDRECWRNCSRTLDSALQSSTMTIEEETTNGVVLLAARETMVADGIVFLPPIAETDAVQRTSGETKGRPFGRP